MFHAVDLIEFTQTWKEIHVALSAVCAVDTTVQCAKRALEFTDRVPILIRNISMYKGKL
jgi:hypothetical protein